MKISGKSFLYLGACVAALTITASCGYSCKTETSNAEPAQSTIPVAERPVAVLPDAHVVDTVSDNGNGLVCNKTTAVPVTLKPDTPIQLSGSTVTMKVTDDGALITSTGGIPARSVIVNGLLGGPIQGNLQYSTSFRTIVLPSTPIVEGGWGDAVDKDDSFEDVVLCRSLTN